MTFAFPSSTSYLSISPLFMLWRLLPFLGCFSEDKKTSVVYKNAFKLCVKQLGIRLKCASGSTYVSRIRTPTQLPIIFFKPQMQKDSKAVINYITFSKVYVVQICEQLKLQIKYPNDNLYNIMRVPVQLTAHTNTYELVIIQNDFQQLECV